MAIAIETTSDPSIWEVVLPAGGQFAIQILLEPNNLEVIRRNLGDRFGIRKGLKFKVDPNEIKRVDAGSQSPQPPRSINQGQLIRSVSNHSLIAQMIESLGAEVTKVDVPPNYRLSDSK